MHKRDILRRLFISEVNAGVYAGNRWRAGGRTRLPSMNPATGKPIAEVVLATQSTYEEVVAEAERAFRVWRRVPAPARGLLIRDIADELRRQKKHLGALVSLEMGKILAEGEGEVQEMIDIADFAVGLSRQLYGLMIASERPLHSMRETWLPLGVVGVITAFNFPAAVWAWNAFIAAVCGNTIIWKPSLKAPLTAIAVQRICNTACARHNAEGVFNLCVGSNEVIGELLIRDPRVPLISATGSTEMGRHVAETVARRLGRTILELGGNNAVIVMDDANLSQAVLAILFGAVGTAGERCTTTRRVIAHEAIFEELKKRLLRAYKKVTVGDPFSPNTLMGPLIDADAVQKMMRAIERIKDEGGKVLFGGEHLGGNFVSPALVLAHPKMTILNEEVFAPILYLLPSTSLEEAIALNNNVPQGLSSALFTERIRNAEFFLGSEGSDCGLANVNTGTSGAEIGGAFGGEKATGGGREAGSTAWQGYMRRQTAVVNWSGALTLAQGVVFGD